MRYVSTRGGMPEASFSDVLLEGLAPDGGLVMPAHMPEITQDTLESWRGLDYRALAVEVIGLFWTDIPREDLVGIIERAYGEQFADPAIVPVTPIGDGLSLLGLSEGPTLAFKDMAMQFLGEAIPYVLGQRDRALNILGATSGDTGSAAEYAFRSKPRIGVFMLSPQGRMSAFQRAQMYSLLDDNIHNIALDGVFDDCQNLVKSLNGDLSFKNAYDLGTVNSINLGRIVAQTVYYIWAWLRATDDATDASKIQVSVTVPSGNFGNIFSGHVARQMGVPIARLVLATNENNVLDEFFRTGVYTPRSRTETHITSSPSMDISKASNLERFVYHLLDADPVKLAEAWRTLDESGSLDLSEHIDRFQSEFGIVSGASTHADRLSQIQQVHKSCGVILDPHTADGVKVAKERSAENERMFVLETAKPQKFEETVTEALGFAAPLTGELVDLLERKQRTVDMADDEETLRDYIAKHHVTAD